MVQDHDKGLAEDLQTMVSGMLARRRALGWLVLAGVASAVGCGDGADTGAGGSAGTGGAGAGGAGTGGAGAGGASTGGAGAGGAGGAGAGGSSSSGGENCTPIPQETGGPYPADGSNGPNALALTGIVRSDITQSVAGASGVAEGVPLTVTMTVLNTKDGCAPLAGYAVYIWHCDRDANYSMYSAAAADENYLRGVQVTDADGKVTFQTIFPGCYPGRWPHIHFEVYQSLALATISANKVATSQLAFPEDACDEAYAANGYSASAGNLSVLSIETDGVFKDGVEEQLAVMSGDASSGFTAELTVAISA